MSEALMVGVALLGVVATALITWHWNKKNFALNQNKVEAEIEALAAKQAYYANGENNAEH